MRELAQQIRRFGSPKLHILLRKQGLVVDHKRTERIYREDGLSLRRRGRLRKRADGARFIWAVPQWSNQRWSMAFATDSVVTGRGFRALAIVDE